MYRALLVEEARRTTEAENALVPNVRVYVESLTAVEPKTHETLGRHVVARQSRRHVERPLIQRKEQLTAIRVIVRMPQHHAARSEEHTSELQSRLHLVCRLLLEKK